MKKICPEWLKSAVFYEIYPSSFFDSNGDGIGDLPGIIAKLDYLTDLGVNALWLNPCFASTFADGGYDISDYRQVAPRYGSNDDLVRLFREAEKRNIKICLDLVAGHTSTEHQWFKESAKAEKNAYSNYYIWNNSWLESTGGLSMVSGMAERDGSFMNNYFTVQPALNYGFANPDPAFSWQLPVDHPDVLKVREEIKNIIRFYLDLGAAGFRCDLAPSLVKKDPGKIQTMAIWREFREMIDAEYPEAVLISEWAYAPQALKAGFHCDFLLHCGTPGYTTLFRNEPKRDLWRGIDKSAFYEKDGNDYTVKNTNSYFDAAGLGDAEFFFRTYLDHYERTKNDGFISIPTGDHDMTRISDFRDERDLACIFAFILTMPGVPFIYYGDEIGMRNIPGLVSKEGGYTRTQARTPMQCDESRNAGFSTAAKEKLYLPVDSAPDAPNVAEQQKRPGSLWHKVKELLKLRSDHKALQADGEFELLLADYPLIYIRSKGDERILTVIQPARRDWQCSIALPQGMEKLSALLETGIAAEISDGKLTFSGNGGTHFGIWKING